MHDPKIIGIDLGTTNSVVAIMEGTEAVVIPNQEGANKTPSVVAFLDNNDCIVGEIARRQAATNPSRTISSIKRLVGLHPEDAGELTEALPYDVVEHEGALLVDVDGFGYTPEQISGLVLKKLKESAEVYLGEEVRQAVITVPANFDDNQRSATMQAAELAGLKVLRLINEPTAAALAYGLGQNSQDEEVVAVYDFGGGTFDITLLEVASNAFEVLTSTGDSHLGGDDLDNALVSMIIEEFEDEQGIDLTLDPVTLRRLKEVTEKAKCELSVAKETTITLPFIAYRDNMPLHLERRLAREEFEEIIEPFVERTIRSCQRALDDAGLSADDIGRVIMVGGSTRIPMVQEEVEAFFGRQLFKGLNPDEVVALGAAIQGGIFSGNIEEVVLMDVVPHSLGVEVKDGRFSRIIEKNAPIPIRASKSFTTTEDDQTFVAVHILQGESEEAAENRSLGKFILSDIPSMERGQARVKVTFFVNADGVMEISAEEASGAAKSLTISHADLDQRERQMRKRARQRKEREKASAGAEAGKEAPKRKRRTRRAPATSRPESTPSSPPEETPAAAADVPASSDTAATRHEEVHFDLLSDTAGGQPKPPETKLEEQRAPAPEPMVGAMEEETPGEPAEVEEPASKPASARSFRRPARYGVPLGGGQAPPPEVPVLLEPESSSASPVVESEPAVTPPPVDQSRSGSKSTSKAPPLRPDPPATALKEKMATRDQRLEWPPRVAAALEALENDPDGKETAGLCRVALAALSEEPWHSDDRYQVRRARVLCQIATGEEEALAEELGALTAKYGESSSEQIEALHERALARFSPAAGLRRSRARLREKLGKLEGACEDLEYATRLEPSKDDQDVLEELYRRRVIEAGDPAAKFKLVKLYLKTNRVDQAIEVLEDLQHVDAYETRAVKILGLCHWQKNLHFLAWQKFKQLRPTEEIRDILYRLAGDMESLGQLPNALAVLEHLAEEAPEYRDVRARVKKLRYRIKLQQEEANRDDSGMLLDPRFTIIEEINRGSMGIIFKAHDKVLDEQVALKVLNDYLCQDPGAVERFKREARAAKRLSHPYIVRIHDLFEAGKKRFLSMEYIDGTDLKRMMAERTTLSEEELIYYFLQICDALSYAHGLGIIHRDIKPANVMITGKRQVKVTDFGIAKILKGDDSTKSGTAVIGTPLYMSPEQVTGDGVDQRSDIYALGIMMYELVSGHPPFYLGNIEYHHIHTPPPPLPDRVSEKLRRVIMRCVAKSPKDRFQTVNEIFEMLEPAGR